MSGAQVYWLGFTVGMIVGVAWALIGMVVAGCWARRKIDRERAAH
jgi:outer membrane murein-binding lipoprotein Lpp